MRSACAGGRGVATSTGASGTGSGFSSVTHVHLFRQHHDGRQRSHGASAAAVTGRLQPMSPASEHKRTGGGGDVSVMRKHRSPLRVSSTVRACFSVIFASTVRLRCATAQDPVAPRRQTKECIHCTGCVRRTPPCRETVRFVTLVRRQEWRHISAKVAYGEH